MEEPRVGQHGPSQDVPMTYNMGESDFVLPDTELLKVVITQKGGHSYRFTQLTF